MALVTCDPQKWKGELFGHWYIFFKWLYSSHLLKEIHDPRMLKHDCFPEGPTLGALASQLLQFLLDPWQGIGIDPVGPGAAMYCLVVPLCTSHCLALRAGPPTLLFQGILPQLDLTWLIAFTPSHIPEEDIYFHSTLLPQVSFLNIEYQQEFF